MDHPLTAGEQSPGIRRATLWNMTSLLRKSAPLFLLVGCYSSNTVAPLIECCEPDGSIAEYETEFCPFGTYEAPADGVCEDDPPLARCCSPEGELFTDLVCPPGSDEIGPGESCEPPACETELICCQGDAWYPAECEDSEPFCPEGGALVEPGECEAPPPCVRLACCGEDIVEIECDALCPDGGPPLDEFECGPPDRVDCCLGGRTVATGVSPATCDRLGAESAPIGACPMETEIDYVACGGSESLVPSEIYVRTSGCCPRFSCEATADDSRVDIQIRDEGDLCDCVGGPMEVPVRCDYPRLPDGPAPLFVNGEPGWPVFQGVEEELLSWCITPAPEAYPPERAFDLGPVTSPVDACFAGEDEFGRPTIRITESCGTCTSPGPCAALLESTGARPSVVVFPSIVPEEGGACPGICMRHEHVCKLPILDAGVAEYWVETPEMGRQRVSPSCGR